MSSEQVAVRRLRGHRGTSLPGLVLLGLVLAACSSSKPPPDRNDLAVAAPRTPYEASRQRMRQKFGDMGVELRVDAFAGQTVYGVEFFPEGSDRPFYAKSAQRFRDHVPMPLVIPERARVVWREIDKPISGKYGMTYAGPLIGDVTIEVGSRIPQEVLDSIRKEGGGLRMKFRLGNEGVYFGWDIQRRPGYDPRRRDARGEIVHVRPVHFLAGGDFREAEIFNGKAVRKGWYIDKKTGQKIETDY